MGQLYSKGLLFLTLIAFCVLSGTPATAAVNQESQEYHDAARVSLEDGDITAAIIQLKNAVRSDPSNYEARYELATLYIRMGDGPSAEKELRAARQGGFQSYNVSFLLAQAYLLQRKSNELLDDIEPEDYQGKERALLHVARSDAYMSLEKFDEAEEEIAKALAAADNVYEPHLGYSRLLQRRGEIEKSEAEVDIALSIDPDNSNSLYQKGELRRVQGDPQGAIEVLSRAIELNSLDPGPRISRALSEIALDQDELAEADVAAILERTPDNPLGKYVRALLLTRQQQHKEALSILNSAPGIEGYAPALYLFGSLYLIDGQLATAREYLERYMIIDPNNDSAKLLLAGIELQKEDVQSAIDTLEPLYSRNPESFQIVFLLANAYLASSRFDEAATLFDKASSLDPENQQVLMRLAQSRFGSGNTDQALTLLESVVSQNPDSEFAYTMLIVGHARSGDFENARKAAANLQERLPESGLPFNFLAALDIAEGNPESARSNLEQALSIQDDFYPAKLNLARLDLSEGKFDDARSGFEFLLEEKPGELQALLGLADVELSVGNADGAMEWLTQAAASNPDLAQPRIMQVNVLVGQDQLDKALVQARSLATDFPENPEAQSTLGLAQQAQGEWASAAATYRQVAKLAPNAAGSHLMLARAHAQLKNYPEAAIAYDRTIELDADQLTARSERITLEEKWRGAESGQQLALEMSSEVSNEIDGKLLVADSYFRTEAYDQAVAFYQDAWSERQTSRLLTQLYRTMEQLSRQEEGAKLLEDWLAENPDDVEIRFLLSGTKIKGGQYAEAVADAERALELQPDNPVIINNLAWLYDQEGDKAKALQFAERAYDIRPTSPEIADTYGWMLLERGEERRALELLRLANERRPENPEIGYHYAVALDRSGNPMEAKNVLEAVISADQDFADADEAKELYQSLNN